MAKFNVSLKVVNSGSPNTLPHPGAASECYLTLGSISPAQPGQMAVSKLFVADIANGQQYDTFQDQQRNAVHSVELDADPASGLALTFSIYFGNRLFDQLLEQALDKAVGMALGGLYSDVLGNDLVGKLIKNRLEAFEKSLMSNVHKSNAEIVSTIGSVVVADFGSLLKDGKVTLPIRSMVDKEEAFLERTVIKTGDLVAEITLTRCDA